MSWLTRISIANRWVTLLIALAIIIGSIFATLQLKTELIPDIELPYAVVFGMHEGYSPEDAMTKISKPAEDEIERVGGLKHIESTSMENMAFVFATFEYGTDMNAAEKEIQRRIDANSDLHDLVQSGGELYVGRVSFEMIPLVWVTVSSDSGMSGAELRSLAEDLVDKVSVVEGILREETPFMKPVEIEGGEESVLVIPKADAMNDYGIPVSWLVSTLKAQSEYTSLAEIRDAQLISNPAIKISDVADVVEPVPTSYTNGAPSVSILWRKDPEANTVDVANAILAKIEGFEASNDSAGVDVTVVMDQSDYIERSINDLARNAIIGVALAGIVVVIFLWAIRASLIITLSIPISILIAFLLMYAFDVTINILTLGGLAIAVGRIVDNSIVSLENIYRHLQRGEGFRQATIDGIKEIAMPITSATIATVAIFVPLVVVGGLVGEMFRPFAWTVTFALLASLVVALMLVPPLSSWIGKRKVSFEGADNWYTRGYTRVLRWSLGHRAITLLIAAGLFVASIFILPLLGTSFLPSGGDKMVSVEIQMPFGNDQDLVEKIGEVEQKIEELGQEEGNVRNYYAYLGSLMGEMERGVASIVIDLSRDADVEQQADSLRYKCQLIPETLPTTIRVIPGGMEEEMMGVGSLEVRVIGDKEGSLEPVQEITSILTERIQALEAEEKIDNLESALVINRTDATRQWTDFGLALTATGQPTVEEAVGLLELEWAMMRFGWPIEPLGQTSPTVEIDGILTEISVPGIAKSLSDLDAIEELRIGAASPVKLGELADVEWGPAEYHRAEGGYSGTIVARIATDDVGAVNREVQEIIDDLELPDGVSEIKMGGIAEQMQEGFSDMFVAIAIAIGIVFLVLTVSFRSWLMPLLIMVSMPLASIGAVLALLVTGKELGMSAMMGILMLVGIVLTNAIVLLTFVDDRRKEGYSAYDALVDAGRIRLRPILMTALTTMIALVPLALGLGEGVLMAAELGVVVIGGLFSSTLLTLLVIPVLYSLTERLRRHPTLPSNSLSEDAGHISNS